MANIRFDADVAFVTTADRNEDNKKYSKLAPSALRSPVAPTSEDEPPLKKQRLNSEGQSIDLEQIEPLGSIPIIRITIDFHFRNVQVSPQLDCLLETFALGPVVLESRKSDSGNGFDFGFVSITEPSSTLHFHTANQHPEETVSQLERLTSLAWGKNAKLHVWWLRSSLKPLSTKEACSRFELEVRWPLGQSPFDQGGTKMNVEEDFSVLRTAFPSLPQQDPGQWGPRDFYENTHVPPLDSPVSARINETTMTSKLYPFQQRAVKWLLEKERVQFENDQSTALSPINSSEQILPSSFQQVTDADGRTFYASSANGIVVNNTYPVMDSNSSLRGGILAEEMGLGKTVELMSLISLHKRTIQSDSVHDEYTGTTVSTSGATLIITPSSILEQWKNELRDHAPHLRVLHYQGMPTAAKSKTGADDASVSRLLKHDVVLTTYQVLAREIYYTKDTPDRELRHKKIHKIRRSPLVQISWWRVCLDEAQMVESGVSQAAIVARLIPRINAWAVSGTPLRKNVDDLRGLLIFLRYEPYSSNQKIWNRLDKDSFKTLFGRIAMRHTKDKIREELRLPPQKRMVITVPFTAVEEQNYSHLFQQMCDICGLTAEGTPTSDDFDPHSPRLQELMRAWLVRLRQTCLHPNVGKKNSKRLGRGNAPLRTVDEVLEVMIEQNETVLRAEERSLILSEVLKGHIIAYGKNDEERSRKALEIYKSGLSKSDDLVSQCRQDLATEKQMQGIKDDAGPAHDQLVKHESDDEEQNPENAGRLSTMRKSLRMALEVQHICAFSVATAYFQTKSNEEITKPESPKFHELEKLETEYYDKAKKMRKELLHESSTKAERTMARIDSMVKKSEFTNVPVVPELLDLGGIENRKILERMDVLGEVLNKQATQLRKWRQKVMDILLMPLVDEDEGKETTGDEYEDSTKAQDELYVYLAVLRAIVADRNFGITGQQNVLIEHENRELLRQAKDDEGHAPQLLQGAMQLRDELKPDPEGGSLRGTVAEIRALATSLQWQGTERANAELSIVERELHDVQAITTAQTKAVASLERELELFRTAMNQRLEFYRQLQAISDSVAPYKDELDEVLDQVALDREIRREQELGDRTARLRTKRRFLLHLREESGKDEQARICIICQSTFEVGVLTVCGHQYCKGCIRLWWNEHRTCPLCKRRLHLVDFHDVTYKAQAVQAQEEQEPTSSPDSSGSPSSSLPVASSLYSDIGASTMNEIKAIDLPGSYGTKVDMIARHLLWIREHDPGAKSIIFSQYQDFMKVLQGALKDFKIGFTNIRDQGSIEKFRHDPSAECFLLDAKSDSSGLNLVNATHVFLCEPLINVALELQAIARVHRIGQQRPTTVYMYLVSDTVEEAIYEISLNRRLAHIGKRRLEDASSSRSGGATPLLQERVIDAANSLEVQEAPLSKLLDRGKSSGEVVEKDDLWDCLFGKRRLGRAPMSGLGGEGESVVEREVTRHLRAEAADSRRT